MILVKLLTSQILAGSSFSDWGFHCEGVRAFLIESAWICGICSASAALTKRWRSRSLFPSNFSETTSTSKLAPHLKKFQNWKIYKFRRKVSIQEKKESGNYKKKYIYPPDVSITCWNERKPEEKKKGTRSGFSAAKLKLKVKQCVIDH